MNRIKNLFIRRRIRKAQRAMEQRKAANRHAGRHPHAGAGGDADPRWGLGHGRIL